MRGRRVTETVQAHPVDLAAQSFRILCIEVTHATAGKTTSSAAAAATNNKTRTLAREEKTLMTESTEPRPTSPARVLIDFEAVLAAMQDQLGDLAAVVEVQRRRLDALEGTG
jgi:hypothetical protein